MVGCGCVCVCTDACQLELSGRHLCDQHWAHLPAPPPTPRVTTRDLLTVNSLLSSRGSVLCGQYLLKLTHIVGGGYLQ